MRKITILALLGSVFLLPTESMSGQTPCASADANSEQIIGVLKNTMEPDAAAARDSLGLPLVSFSEIALVSDPAVCARAGEAADSVFRTWSPGVTFTENPPVYVVRVGTSFVVADLSAPPNPNNEFRTAFVFGPMWVFRRLMLL